MKSRLSAVHVRLDCRDKTRRNNGEAIMVKVDLASSHAVTDAQSFAIWKEQLFQLSSSLSTLTTTTEDEFLEIGRAMTDFYERAGEITRMLSSLLGIMSGNDIARTVDGVEDILDRIKHGLSGAETAFGHDLKTLHQTLEIMNGIRKPLEGFKKLVKILKILSISTKIESAQLGQDKTGFITLADDVEKLSVEIDEETKMITTKVLLLDNIVRQNISQISSLEKNQHREIYTVLDDIGFSLISLKSKNELSREGADLISEQSERISRHIGEVVGSMQFHDITRQTIEHVGEVLDNLAQKLSAENLQGTIEKTENNNNHLHLISEAGDICELQRAQLDDAKQQITGATGNIIDHLLLIKRSIMEISHKAGSLAGIADESSLSFLSKIETGIATAMLSLGTFSRASHDLSEAMDSFLKTTVDVSGSVNDIEEIGAEIQLIALNARIKTAHTGEEGAPLGVIAEAIQRLSSDANTEKTAISTALNDVTLAAHDIQSCTREDQDNKTSEADNMIRDFGGFADTLRSANGEITSLLNNIAKSGERLGDDIAQTVLAITVHEKFERIIDNAVSILSLIIKEFRQMAPRSESGNKSEYLRHLEENYTMHSERKIHSLFAGSDGDIAAKSVPDTGNVTIQFINGKPETHQEFGDNVELF
jgi:methyl-accepting chemotaxis protein